MLMYSWWAGFRRLPVEVQVKLAQDSVYPVTLIFHSQFYNLNTGEYNWFINTPQERDLVLGILPPFAALGSHFSSTGFALRSLSLTDVEMAFLAAMAVLTATGHVTFSLSFWRPLAEKFTQQPPNFGYPAVGLDWNNVGLLSKNGKW